MVISDVKRQGYIEVDRKGNLCSIKLNSRLCVCSITRHTVDSSFKRCFCSLNWICFSIISSPTYCWVILSSSNMSYSWMGALTLNIFVCVIFFYFKIYLTIIIIGFLFFRLDISWSLCCIARSYMTHKIIHVLMCLHLCCNCCG